jgi:hypothetical protein
MLLADGGERYPYRSDIDSYCRNVEITPFGTAAEMDSGTGLVTHEKALVTATYSVNRATLLMPSPIHPGKLFSETYEPTIEFMTLDFRSFEWEVGYEVPDVINVETGRVETWRTEYALQPEQAPGRQMHGAIYTYTRQNLPAVPGVLQTLEGSINQESFTSLTFGRTFAAQSCLLLPSPTDASWSLIGGMWTRRASMQLRIHYKQIPSWNKFWRPDLYDGSDWSSAWGTIWDSEGNPVESYPVKSWAGLW